MRGKRGEADGLERDRFAAGVGPLMTITVSAAAERERQRHDCAALRAQRVFEHGMARGFEAQANCPSENSGMRAIEFARETRARKHGIEIGDCRGGGFERAAIGAHRSVSSARMRAISAASSSAELHEAIIQLDGFERLDENRLARGAGARGRRRERRGDRAARTGMTKRSLRSVT